MKLILAFLISCSVSSYLYATGSSFELKKLPEQYPIDKIYKICETLGVDWELASTATLTDRFKELKLDGYALTEVVEDNEGFATSQGVNLKTGVPVCLTNEPPKGKFYAVCAKAKGKQQYQTVPQYRCKEFIDQGVMTAQETVEQEKAIKERDEKLQKQMNELEKRRDLIRNVIPSSVNKTNIEKYCYMYSVEASRLSIEKGRSWCYVKPSFDRCVKGFSKEGVSDGVVNGQIDSFLKIINDAKARQGIAKVMSEDEILNNLKNAKPCM